MQECIFSCMDQELINITFTGSNIDKSSSDSIRVIFLNLEYFPILLVNPFKIFY